MSKQEWKESGTDLGHAFQTFGKTFVRSAKTTGDKITDWAEDKKPEEQPESTVYSDGSWKKTGKELGGAFAGMGKTLLHTVGIGNGNEAKTAQDDKDEVVVEADNITETTDGATDATE